MFKAILSPHIGDLTASETLSQTFTFSNAITCISQPTLHTQLTDVSQEYVRITKGQLTMMMEMPERWACLSTSFETTCELEGVL